MTYQIRHSKVMISQRAGAMTVTDNIIKKNTVYKKVPSKDKDHRNMSAILIECQQLAVSSAIR